MGQFRQVFQIMQLSDRSIVSTILHNRILSVAYSSKKLCNLCSQFDFFRSIRKEDIVFLEGCEPRAVVREDGTNPIQLLAESIVLQRDFELLIQPKRQRRLQIKRRKFISQFVDRSREFGGNRHLRSPFAECRRQVPVRIDSAKAAVPKHGDNHP